MRSAAAVLLAVILTACGSPAEDEPSEASTRGAITTAPSNSPTPTPTPTPTTSVTTDLDVTWVCQGSTYFTMEEAWEGQHTNCIDTTARGIPSKREIAAVRAAYGDRKRGALRLVAILYGICGENFDGWPKLDKDPLSPAAAKEVRGAVMLCPSRPGANRVTTAVRESDRQAERERNRMAEGTYLVGTEVNPGTYVAEPLGGGCYWERTDRSGNVIDNNFSNGARVEFTIAPSDYSVTVQGCGDWRRAR